MPAEEFAPSSDGGTLTSPRLTVRWDCGSSNDEMFTFAI
jgi:hypothetical protein